MNKLDGLNFLKYYLFNTVELISFDYIMSDDYKINDGLSVRLASKNSNSIDVYLPSLHNCFSKEQIKLFYEQYNKDYYILIHKTVNPNSIGSLSKYDIADVSKIVIEIFSDFEKRKRGIIEERYLFDVISDKYLKYDKNIEKKYIDLVRMVNIIPFKSFDIEFVTEYGEFIFTDFYSKEFRDSLKEYVRKRI